MQEVQYNKIVREKLLKGINTVADSVLITMGPKGRVVAIKETNRPPRFTRDGVSVARSIKHLPDEIEDAGAHVIKAIAEEVNMLVGDATSTACALTKSLANESVRGIDLGLDRFKIKQGLDEAVGIVIEDIKTLARPVKTKRQMSDVATISSRDRVIGDVIAEIYSKVGPDGLIDVENSQTVGTHYELVQGTQIDSGWISPWFITNLPKLEASIENPYVFLTTRKLTELEDVFNLIDHVISTESKSLVIVAENVEGQALETLIRNRKAGSIKVVALKAPGVGDDKKEFLEDLASLTGAKVLTENDDYVPETMPMDILGRCAKVVSTRQASRFVGGGGKKSNIQARLALLKAALNNEKSSYRKETLSRRFSRLSGGVAILYTGSVSQEESSEKVDRIEDAINNTKSAIAEGIVPGGGFAFFKASVLLKEISIDIADHDVRFGYEAVLRAICLPAQQILLNAGYEPTIILHDTKARDSDSWGFDSGPGLYGDLFKLGVVDSLKAERIALEQVVSRIGLLLVADASVSDIIKKE